MPARLFLAALLVVFARPAAADEPTAKVIAFHGYDKAIELKLGKTRAVLCPQVGGRVLEFSVDGKDAMYLDDGDRNWKPGKPPSSSAGRFDYGPELTVAPQDWQRATSTISSGAAHFGQCPSRAPGPCSDLAPGRRWKDQNSTNSAARPEPLVRRPVRRSTVSSTAEA